MKEQFEALLNIARSAWRFRWSALLVVIVVAAVGVLGVLAMPGQYESRAQIYVDTKSVLRPLLQGVAIASQTRDETDVVRRALLARPSLDRVAHKTGLSARANTPERTETLITDLSDLITIKGDSSLGLYQIAYADSSPRMAQSVVQTLLDTFVESSVGAGRTDNQSAERFLAQQVAEYERRLSESERELAEFKKKNIGLMPDQRGDYFVRLQAENANRTKVRTDLAVALQQRDELRRKLASDVQGSAVLSSPPTNQQIQGAVELDARIRETRQELDGLLDRFTDRHPQVLALQETLRRLEEQRQVELGGVRATNAARSETSRMAIDPVVQSLQIALNSADVQVAALQTQLRQSEEQVGELQRTVTTGPEIEATLARLNRDYGVTKAQYEILLQRLETARISNDVDRSEELRFKILEPPRVPIQPIAPNRLMLILAVLVAALGAGSALALLRSLTQPVYFSKAALAKSLNLPVIGVVSMGQTTSELRAGSRDRILCGAAFAAVAVVTVLAGVFSYSASQTLRQAMGMGDG